jgi:hypothetical protein
MEYLGTNDDGRQELQIPWHMVEEIIGHPHGGFDDDDQALIGYLQDHGYPSWTQDENIRQSFSDEHGWGLIGPQIEADHTVDIEDRIFQAIEAARGCSQGHLFLGSDIDEPFFDMGLQGSMSHQVICPDFWAEVRDADNSDDPEESLRDLVADMVRRVEAHTPDEEMTATFEEDDFEAWWLNCMEREDPVSEEDREQLLQSCLELAENENREMLQSEEDLRDAIDAWADSWNERLG